jgi:hypothetical protein
VLDFHVPAPALAWGRSYRGQVQVDLPWRGFSAIDGSGVVPIGSVELEGPTAVRIRLDRVPQTAPLVRYADQSVSAGLGCLHDSDAAVEKNGDALANWCVGFVVQMT